MFARCVSVVAHPFVMAALMVAGAAFRLDTPREAARALGLVALVAVLPVALLMAWKVRRGSWSNVDASNREERPVLFLVGAAGLVALIAWTMLARPESFLIRGALGALGMLAACALATRWLKISLHMAFATLATTTLLLLESPLGWPLLATVPLLAWSRVRLGRHAVAEVVAGAIAGIVFGWAIHAL